MAKPKIAWLPGDGIGVEVLDAARVVLDRLGFEAEYLQGDIGWECWCREGEAFPQRTIDLLKSVDAAMFGAITSKPVKEAEAELASALQGKGMVYRSPIVRMRQLFDLYVCLRPCRAYPGEPSQLQGGHRPSSVPGEYRGPIRRGGVRSCAGRTGCNAWQAFEELRSLPGASGERNMPSPARSTRGPGRSA